MVIEIKGNWKTGFALDLHTKSSTYLGSDELGHDQFDTVRTEIGELVYSLKYKKDNSVVFKIVETICNEFKNLSRVDYIIPIPPSKKRDFQPVNIVADALGLAISVPVLKTEVLKVKATPQLKDISDLGMREDILRNAFSLAGKTNIENKNILLIDDLYRSGATLRAITSILYDSGNVKNVYALTLTKTRSSQ